MNAADLRRVAGDLHTVQAALPAGAIELAYHASLPVAVDPLLLHLCRVNFLPDLPYDVEARLLLSPLFHELGDGLYEIKSELRDLLLAGLVARFGPDRLRRTAVLLERYTDLPTSWPASPELAHAQRLTALHVLRPEEARRWLDHNESTSDGAGLGRTWFVAMRRQIASVPADEEGLLDRALRAAVARLTRPDRRRRVVDVRAVVALLSLPGGPSVGSALDALRVAALDPDPVVSRLAGEAVARFGRGAGPAPDGGGESDRSADDGSDAGTHLDELPDPAASRVVLVDDAWPTPGTERAFQELVDVLADANVWGVAPAHCQVLTGHGRNVGAALRQAAGEVGPTGLLLIHYLGRGQDDDTGGGLLPYRASGANPVLTDINEARVLSSAGRTLISYDIGDSVTVFAGRRGADVSRPWQQRLRDGTVLPAPFVAALTRVLRAGVPDGSDRLTLGTLLDAVARALVGGEVRHPSTEHDEDRMVLFRNRAARRSPLVGRVLVAAPDIGNPDLHHAALLVLRDHPVEGTMAVRLNGAVDDRLVRPEARSLPALRSVVRVGGPPSTKSGYVAVALLRRGETPPPEFLPLGDRIGVLTRPTDPSREYHSLAAVQLVRGYLGWPPGRLEELLASGSLRVMEHPNDVLVDALRKYGPEDLWTRLVRPARPALLGVPRPGPGLDELLDELVASLNGGEKVSLILGDAVDRPTVVVGEDDVPSELRPASRPGLSSLGRLLAKRGEEFAQQVFTTKLADDVARAVRNADHRATVLRHAGQADAPTDNTVQVFSVFDLPVSERDVGLMAGSIAGDHVCVVGHDGISGAIVAALRLLGRLRSIQVTWVSTSPGRSEAETDRSAAIRQALGVPVTFYFGVDVDRLFTQLCDRLGLPASPATLLDAVVRFPRGEEKFVVDL